MLRRKIISAFVLYAVLLPALAFGQTTAPAVYTAPKEAIDKIKEEGTEKFSDYGNAFVYDRRDRRAFDQFALDETRQRMDARSDGEMGNAERASRSVGTVGTRLVFEKF